MSWDDGKHTKVNRVQLTFDDVIRSIQVEYEGTNLQSQRRGTVGTKSDGFTLSTDEYITDVSGYYKTTFSGDVITALTFKTNKNTYGPYGNKTQNYFSADAPRDHQIAGFLGTSSNALSSIDVHFAPIPPPGSIKPKPDGSGVNPGEGSGSKPDGSGVNPGDGSGSNADGPGKMGPLGGDKGNEFNDVGFDGVKKITVGVDEYSVTYIKVEYINNEKVTVREHGTIRGELKEFSVDYPKDNIVAVGGSYNHIFNYDTTLITSLYFTTSKGFISPLFGKAKGTDFNLKGENGGKLLGFHGRGGFAIDAIGAYFDTGSQGGQGGDPNKGGSTPVGPGKIGPLGGDKGKEFNDVGFDGVKKVTVGADEYSVSYIKIEYMKDGNVEIREHGTSRGELKEFLVDYPKDNITAVGGTYNHIFNYDTTLITSLYFTTSKGFTSPLFGKAKGTEFNLKGENGGKLLGFHGRGGFAIDAIGAYFDIESQGGQGSDPNKGGSTPVGPGKIGPLGGDKGKEFNDVGFDGVKKVTVGADEYSVAYIKIEYVKDGKVEVREHGTNRGELKEFSVDYPKDYITVVGGSYNHIFNYDTTLITSLYFTTSKGYTSPLFGKAKGTEFNLKSENGGKLLGFHGRGGFAIDAIGAYFDTGSQGSEGSDPSKGTPIGQGKMGPLGGEKGKEFNDVGFDGVKKITVAADEYSVTYIKIEYVKAGNVEVREHGTSRGELKEFSVDYPTDNIVAVGGSYNHIFNYDTTLITSLYFTTSKGFTSPLFGKTKGKDFSLKSENGGKLFGFHGRGGFAIDAIGAYFDIDSQGGDGGNPSKDGSKHDVPGKKGPLGGDKGEEFSDVGFEGVKKITVGADDLSITYIKIEYVKKGKVEIREHGTARGELKEFLVDYPQDSITVVGGSYKHVFTYDTTLIKSLYFTTSKGFNSPVFGTSETKGTTKFEFKGENGEKLLGFHGRGGNAIDAIGAYFDTGSKPVGPDSSDGSNSGGGPSSDSSTQKLDAQGSKGGNQWDDGGDHGGVTKIHVAVGRVIEQIRFDYLKNGQTKEGPAHGVKGARSSISTIEINHPNEYLLSVKGWSDSSNKIVGIQFITNTKTSDYYGFEKYPGEEGTDISLEVKDKKIVGFHGFADTHLNSLGAYLAPITSTPLKRGKKLKAAGGDEGTSWDDGAFDSVRKIQVGQNNDGVCYVAIEYDNGSQIVYGDGHGKKSALGVETFELLYPGEYIEAVGIYYDKVHIDQRGVTLVTSLIFKTNKQESPPFGMTGGEYVELKEQGHKIVGFHGKASDWIHQIGVYVAPITN